MAADPLRVLLSLGSNLGDRKHTMRGALDAIASLPGTRVHAVSSVYESEPWGVVEQPRFLNAAAVIETVLTPLELLHSLKTIERQLGREPGGPKWGPRVIDIDIVLWGDRQIGEPGLRVPHPEFRRRAFVLEPLAEIAPDAMDPVTGLTVAELARRPGVEGAVIKGEAIWPTDLHRLRSRAF